MGDHGRWGHTSAAVSDDVEVGWGGSRAALLPPVLRREENMKRRFFLLVAVSLGISMMMVTSLAAEFSSQLRGELEALEAVLNDYILAPGSIPGWGDYEYARYTGGRLSSLGYEVQLARSGDKWWVVVFLSDSEKRVPVPIVPGYSMSGKKLRGTVLGHIAGTWTGGVMSFLQGYLQWEELVILPSNQPPAAFIRALHRQVVVGDLVRFLGVLSADPDGSIVRYIWDFGDGKRSFGMNANHRYDEPGHYTVTLTVVDGGGLMAQTSIEVTVLSEEGESGGGSGCGCGG